MAIIGDGPMGLIHLHLAKASGARVTVSGHHKERLELAEKLGADKTVNSKEENMDNFPFKNSIGEKIVV